MTTCCVGVRKELKILRSLEARRFVTIARVRVLLCKAMSVEAEDSEVVTLAGVIGDVYQVERRRRILAQEELKEVRKAHHESLESLSKYVLELRQRCWSSEDRIADLQAQLDEARAQLADRSASLKDDVYCPGRKTEGGLAGGGLDFGCVAIEDHEGRCFWRLLENIHLDPPKRGRFDSDNVWQSDYR